MADVVQRVLLVEDSSSSRQMLEHILRSGGFDVISAENGQEALEVLQLRRPDAIVSDIMMPEMDGYEFYRQVRSQGRYALVPFLFLTAKEEIQDQVYGLSLGADDYITKPIEAEELLARIRTALKRTERFFQVYQRDPVTGMMMPEPFREQVVAEEARSERFQRQFSIMTLKLDQLSSYRKEFGDFTADAFLEQVGALLGANMRKYNQISRSGPDHFTVLLPEASAQDAQAAGGIWKDRIANERFTSPQGGRELDLTATAVTATYPEGGGTSALLEHCGVGLERKW
ncbi:response regulator [Thiohalorhabdus sp. Cl-TMA]|uniref:Response regulator n=1 Tax=Thiohalorhabdus methylotrophus TaxID=3242694 RepID=A0ABV4TXU2_9GAMM